MVKLTSAGATGPKTFVYSNDRSQLFDTGMVSKYAFGAKRDERPTKHISRNF